MILKGSIIYEFQTIHSVLQFKHSQLYLTTTSHTGTLKREKELQVYYLENYLEDNL